MADKTKPPNHKTFSALLNHNGFAPEAISLIATKPVLKSGDSRANGRARLMSYFDNYYMQFMALQLERYGFQLNRAHIPATELNYAAGLIGGKHGNPALDTVHLSALLAETVEALMDAQSTKLMTWNEFFACVHITADGSSIRGQDIIKGLIKSNLMHKGAAIENYSHTFRNHTFATLSMMQVMEQQLTEFGAHGIATINRFGQPISVATIHEARRFAATITALRDPTFSDYVNMSTHTRIKTVLKAILTALNAAKPNLAQLNILRLQLERDYSTPLNYGKPWQDYLYELDDYLRRIAAPYV